MCAPDASGEGGAAGQTCEFINVCDPGTACVNPMLVPTVRETLRGGDRIDVPLGLNYYFADGPLKGHRIAAEYTIPVWQDLNGPQLQSDGVLTIGWQKSFESIGHD